jgi:hypothetical protein
MHLPCLRKTCRIMNKQQTEFCVLCGLPVQIEGFALETKQGLQKFCCAGCLCMYQLINEDNQQDKTETPLNNN